MKLFALLILLASSGNAIAGKFQGEAQAKIDAALAESAVAWEEVSRPPVLERLRDLDAKLNAAYLKSVFKCVRYTDDSGMSCGFVTGKYIDGAVKYRLKAFRCQVEDQNEPEKCRWSNDDYATEAPFYRVQFSYLDTQSQSGRGCLFKMENGNFDGTQSVGGERVALSLVNVKTGYNEIRGMVVPARPSLSEFHLDQPCAAFLK